MIPARWTRLVLQALPGVAIVLVVLADQSVGTSVLVGLAVVAPLLAANVAGPRLTAAYGVLALVTAAVLGVVDHLYGGGDATHAQLVRLGAITVMTVVAVLLSRYRLERERRLTQVMKVAEAAQRAILLPVPERLGTVRVAVHYESAASEALIGGDMYGLVVTGHGLRVLVGDVRGKGLDAVRMSAQVLATFRERAGDDPDLPALMDHMDRSVGRSAETDEDFVTAVLVQLADDGRVTVANAGHPAPILLSGGKAVMVDPPAPRPPLGLGGTATAVSLTMAPADRLLLYTDGLTEARDPREGEFFSPRSIVEAIRNPSSVGEAVAGLRDGVLRWSGGALHDDIALVLIEYQPGPVEASTRPAEPVVRASAVGAPVPR